MIARALQRSYGLPALAALPREAVTACAEMWLAFERRRAAGGGPAPREGAAGAAVESVLSRSFARVSTSAARARDECAGVASASPL